MWRENSGKNIMGKKNGKTSGRTDPKFGISRSRNPCMQNFSPNGALQPQFRTPQNFQLFWSLLPPETRIFFRRFPLFSRFWAERTSRAVGNLDVSVSNDPFSPRNSFSSRFFGRMELKRHIFGQIENYHIFCNIFIVFK